MANCRLRRHYRILYLRRVGLGIDYQWMTSVGVNEAPECRLTDVSSCNLGYKSYGE